MGDGRPRADLHMTADTEQSMSEAEQLHLLNSAPFDAVYSGDDGEFVAAPLRSNQSIITKNRSMLDSMDGDGGYYLAMFGGEEESDDGNDKDGTPIKLGEQPPKKRRKTGKDETADTDNEFGVLNVDSGDDFSSASSLSDDNDDEEGG